MTDPIPRLRRLLTMIPLLRRSEGITVDELTKLLKVKRKEVVDDLKRLNFVGVPPYLPHDYITILYDGDRISIDYADHWKRPAALTLKEALALKLALEALPPGDETFEGAKTELRSALDRLAQRQGGLSQELEGSLAQTASDETGKKLRKLKDAADRRRPLDIVYYSASSEATASRRVHPLGLAEGSGNHYLIAFDLARQAPLHFRVDRIASVDEPKGAAPFERPKGFDLDEYVKAGFGPRVGHPIRILFDATVARFAKEDYDGLPTEELAKGDLAVEMQCGSLTWGVSRALSYGEHAEILAPPEARAELRRRLEGFLASRGKRK
ncbi:WYL domain-containing protein [bacterium]|nr:WYL domain-containing protein [bacterium]